METRTDRAAVACRLTEVRAELLSEHPFFGRLLLQMGIACAPCGTACTDGERLIFDPEFACRLSGRELKFVMLHEILHCVLNHVIRRKTLHVRLYNIACDIVVNSLIISGGYETYYAQPLEESAREFAEEETKNIMSRVSK